MGVSERVDNRRALRRPVFVQASLGKSNRRKNSPDKIPSACAYRPFSSDHIQSVSSIFRLRTDSPTRRRDGRHSYSVIKVGVNKIRVLSKGGMTHRFVEFVGCAIEEEAERTRWCVRRRSGGMYTWLRGHVSRASRRGWR